MSDTNLAQEATGHGEALTVDAGADALTGILSDPISDLPKEDQSKEAAPEEAPAEGDKPEAEATEEAATEEVEQEQDGQQESYVSGKFAADTANVRLKDGSVISVQDLKRGYLSQASFTRGTQENAKERETLASQKAEVENHARALQAQRDFLVQASQQFLPQAPDESLLDNASPNYDPLRYLHAKADYDRRVSALNQMHQASQAELARIAKEQQGQAEQVRSREATLLLESMPELRKPDVYRKFWSDAVETMAEYGFSAEELGATTDHRTYKVFRDLAAYRRARSKLPAVKEQVESRPVLTGKKRMEANEKSSREKSVRSEQLRNTGTFDAGVSALMDFDL